MYLDRRRASARYGTATPSEGRLYLGLVESTSGGKVQVRVGDKLYPLPSAGMDWAAPYSTVDSTNGRTLTSTNGVLHPGDVVWVTPMNRSRVFTIHAITNENVENKVAARMTRTSMLRSASGLQFSFTPSSSERP